MSVRRLVAAVSCGAALVLSGCGGGSSAGGGTAEDAESSAVSPSVSPTAEASKDPYDGVVPASGPEMELEPIRARMPQGWRPDELTSLIRTGYQGGRFVSLAQTVSIVPGSMNELAKRMQSIRIDAKRLRRTDNVWIDGKEWITVEGWSTGRAYYIVMHAIPLDDSQVTMTFTFASAISAAERSAVMNSVLATVEWL